MRLAILFTAILVGSLTAQANSKSLFIAGTVPLRGDIEIKASSAGKVAIKQNSPDKLKIQMTRRGPASVVSATAP
ncbi:hypothetical protein [Bdellovibrio svalbardensis]|uniref:Organic solvent tolerance-like N-terminal domain-containing protein n=1 Tax=Bdellovibrio svalbardensis TaxID=2972972 RepID=A0ABT6DD64_9BACT|nr:hypothetical protein [Bdellovibrio svalbardensis]MDG0814752.1 hypothetical protein [Bdellovibrio svalbardensis]